MARAELPRGTDSSPGADGGGAYAEMRRRKIAVPGIYTVERLAWESRRRARDEVERKLTEGLSRRAARTY